MVALDHSVGAKRADLLLEQLSCLGGDLLLRAVLRLFVVADCVDQGNVLGIAVIRHLQIGVGLGIDLPTNAAAGNVDLIHDIARKNVGVDGGGDAGIKGEILVQLLNALASVGHMQVAQNAEGEIGVGISL
jgi:hypothetical protein